MLIAKLKSKILTLLLFLSVASYAQDKLIDIGTNYYFKDTLGFNFSFSFNRTEEKDETGGYIYVKPVSEFGTFGIKPSTEANIGRNVESSPNNVILDIGCVYDHLLNGGWLLKTNFTPTGASNKNFDNALLYGSIGGGILYFKTFSTSVKPKPFYCFLGVNWDYGNRVIEKSHPNTFNRLTPSFELNYKFGKHEDAANPKKEFYRVAFSINAKAYVIKNDTTVIANGGYGFLTTSLDLKFTKKIGMTIKYIVGHEEPSYTKLNAISIGLSFF